MLKNTIIAALATFIYHSYIVEGTPTVTKVYAVVCWFVVSLAIMLAIDSIIQVRRYKRVHMIKRRSFARYKEWIASVVERKAVGQGEEYRKKIIINIITHQKKYSFSGKQISELLDLAKCSAERSA